MPGELARARRNAVLLTDDSIGVSTEQQDRRMQANGQNSTWYVTLNPDWVQQLNIDQQSAPTKHSVSMGHRPVIVQNPAIIIQPAAVLDPHL